MAFLSKEELKTVVDIEVINKITAGDDNIIETIIDETISLMKGYLSKYYNVDAIFSAEGNNRHKTVLKRLKDICIYEIYERHTKAPNQVAKRRYEESMLWLEKLNVGEYYDRTMPARIKEDDTAISSDDIRFGGYNRYTSNY